MPIKLKADKAETSQPKEKSQAKENSSAFSAVFLSRERSQVKQDWYIDSGASQHMTPHDDWFEQSKQAPINEILTASNSKLTFFFLSCGNPHGYPTSGERIGLCRTLTV